MPLDISLAKAALRARLTSTVFATTGTMSLAATTTGYTRQTGSFIADGFIPGMEVTPEGFPVNPVDVITEVEAQLIKTQNAHAAASGAISRALSVKPPRNRAFDGMQEELSPGIPAFREAFAHTASTLLTTSPDGGSEADEMAYLVTLIGPKLYGADPLDRMATLLSRRFAPGTVLTSGGQTVSVRFSPAPFAGQVLPHPTPGFIYRLLTVPLRASLRASRVA